MEDLWELVTILESLLVGATVPPMKLSQQNAKPATPKVPEVPAPAAKPEPLDSAMPARPLLRDSLVPDSSRKLSTKSLPSAWQTFLLTAVRLRQSCPRFYLVHQIVYQSLHRRVRRIITRSSSIGIPTAVLLIHSSQEVLLLSIVTAFVYHMYRGTLTNM